MGEAYNEGKFEALLVDVICCWGRATNLGTDRLGFECPGSQPSRWRWMGEAPWLRSGTQLFFPLTIDCLNYRRGRKRKRKRCHSERRRPRFRVDTIPSSHHHITSRTTHHFCLVRETFPVYGDTIMRCEGTVGRLHALSGLQLGVGVGGGEASSQKRYV
jgi:hypothetical protein